MFETALNTTWKPIAEAKAAERTNKLPASWIIPAALLPDAAVMDVQDWPHTSGFFTKRELEITEVTASEVVVKIASGEWTAVEVITAVSKRAAVAQQLVNCLTEIMFDQGLARAKELDAYFAKTGKTVGPLHGLPISLKDQFNLIGVDSTIGYVSFANKPSKEDSTLVTLLAQAGAVFYCKTNVPATLMQGESINNIWGRTVNSRNRGLTTGGSSGGESSLVQFKGSFIGVGTDIGGSIRAPCSLTGLYGLRPTHGRVSYQGATNTYVGQEAIRSTAGPMCRSSADVRLFMSSLAAQKPWTHDPQCLPIPWREAEEKLPAQLRFAWSMGDGVVTPSPPIARAMMMTKLALEAAGHLVIDMGPVKEMVESTSLAFALWAADGGVDLNRDLSASGEPWHPNVASWGHPSVIKNVPSVADTWDLQAARADLASRYHKWWQASGFDGIICPTTPLPALKHLKGDEGIGTLEYCVYGCLSPVLGLTTGVFPVTKVDQVRDIIPSSFVAKSEYDQRVMDFYGSPKNHENALIGLSIIGGILEEEKVVAMMAVIEAALAAGGPSTKL